MQGVSRPNLLFIFSDQHAQHVTGCYGDPVVRTPALDGLAERGVTATNAYCASPICVPSRMSMLTACHPHRQDVWTNDDFLASDRPTWLHALGRRRIPAEADRPTPRHGPGPVAWLRGTA